MRGATSNLELPKLRFLICVLRFPNRASVPDQNAGELGFGCIFAMRTRAATKAASTLKEGLRSISFAQSLRRMMHVVMLVEDENNLQRRPNYGQIES